MLIEEIYFIFHCPNKHLQSGRVVFIFNALIKEDSSHMPLLSAPIKDRFQCYTLLHCDENRKYLTRSGLGFLCLALYFKINNAKQTYK